MASISRRRTANAFGVRATTSTRHQSRSLLRSSEKSPNVRRRSASTGAPGENHVPTAAREEHRSALRALRRRPRDVAADRPSGPRRLDERPLPVP